MSSPTVESNVTHDYRLLSKKDVAEKLGCTTRTVDRLVAAKKIPFTYLPTAGGRLGRKLKFISCQIDAWILSHSQLVAIDMEGAQ